MVMKKNIDAMNHPTKVKESIGERIYTIVVYLLLILISATIILPLLHIISGSFSDPMQLLTGNVSFWPKGFTTSMYEKVLKDASIWKGYLNTILYTVLGTLISVTLTACAAYPLSRKDLFGRNIFISLFIFTMFFNGGMIPTFLLVKSYGLLNTVWALVLPGAVPIFNVILVMNFFAAVPKELEEAAFIDGANPLQVLTKIFIPISKPVLATVSLFSIVGSWNDFYSGLIYMSKAAYYPLMTYIQSLQINVEDLIKQGNLSAVVDSASLGNTNLNAAKIVIAVIPLLLIYPLLQRYFVSGIVVGSVKG